MSVWKCEPAAQDRSVSVWWCSAWQINRSFTHQIKEDGPTLQPRKQHNRTETTLMWCRSCLQHLMRKKKYWIYVWKSVCHAVCPTDSSSHFSLKNSVCLGREPGSSCCLLEVILNCNSHVFVSFHYCVITVSANWYRKKIYKCNEEKSLRQWALLTSHQWTNSRIEHPSPGLRWWCHLEQKTLPPSDASLCWWQFVPSRWVKYCC